ncbi:MAG: HNH endonuclease, partial [Candidatus Eremiobacteraeota bacterium]|nr:HNH endonuclease [Candidatus Eremiobacteraeota bacterium]
MKGIASSSALGVFGFATPPGSKRSNVVPCALCLLGSAIGEGGTIGRKFRRIMIAVIRVARRLRGEIKPRTRTISLEIVLRSSSGRWCKKAKLLREAHLANCCTECGISEWRGKPLAIQIDHINGVGSDWRIENLRMLCSNCHSQTATFAGRNVRRGRKKLQECP